MGCDAQLEELSQWEMSGRDIGVARVFAAGLHSTVASNGDDLLSHRSLLQYVTLKHPKLTTLYSPAHEKLSSRHRALHLTNYPLN